MKIGNLEFSVPVFLAPMAGVTDTAYRILAREMGCELVYSEMVSDKGINYRNKNPSTRIIAGVAVGVGVALCDGVGMGVAVGVAVGVSVGVGVAAPLAATLGRRFPAGLRRLVRCGRCRA